LFAVEFKTIFMSSNKISNSFIGQRSFKKFITLLSLLLLGMNGVMGQIAAFNNTWSGTPTTVNATTTAANIGTITMSRGSGITAGSSTSRFSSSGFASGTSLTISNNDYYTFTITANSGYTINLNSAVLSISLGSSGTGPQTYGVYSSVGGFASTSAQIGANLTAATSQTITFPSSGYNSLSSIEIRIYGWNASAGTGTGGPSSISLTGSVASVGGPNITQTGLLNTFIASAVSSPSAEQSFTVSGYNLTNDIVITPPTGYQISTSTGGSFSPTNPITLTQSSGTVATTTIYARFNPTALVDQVGGNIAITSTGATTQNVAVSGEVTNLSAGAIAFVAFQGATTDLYRIVALNNIPNNTRIWFTDKSWDGGTLSFVSGEVNNVWTNTTGSAIAAGTVIQFDALGGATIGTGGLNNGLGSAGEQLFAYQGTLTSPTFVAGYTSGTVITTGVTTATSTYVPAGLTSGTNFVALGDITFGSSYVTAAIHNRSLADMRSHIHNTANLTTGNTTTITNGSWPTYTFNIIADEPTTQPSFSAATSVGNNQIDLNFSGGNGTSYMVVMREGSAVTATPTDATNYSAVSGSVNFSTATELSAGQRIVYNGTTATGTVTVTNLSAGTAYHYAIYAYNGTTTNTNFFLTTPGTGNQLTTAPPTITTTATPASITHNTASSGGQTISGSGITTKGVAWSTSTAPTVALSTITNDGTGTTDFSSSISSLAPETFYYIRAFATNASGTGYGDEKTFRTLSAPTTVQASSLSATASSPSNIDLSWTAATFPSTGASASGYVLLRATSPNTPTLGNSNGASPSAGSNTTIVSSTIASNASSISSSGLVPSTQYNYLLIPFTWDGTNTSTYNYLTTSAPTANATTQGGSTAPLLVTNTSNSITDVTATFNGDVTNDGSSAITERGFVYSISDATPTIGEAGVTQQTVSGTTGVFSYNASSLSAYTLYYTQAYATNSAGTTYGGVDQFTTFKSEPSAQATSLVFSSITSTAFNSAFTAAVGSPDGYIVLSSTSSSLSSNPIDGTTYTAGNSLGGGTVISVGSSLSGIANTSLSSVTTYYIFVYAYNNSGSNINYLSTSPLSASTITLTDAPATPTFSSVNTTSFTIDWTATSGASSYRLDLSTVSDFSSFMSGYQDLTVSSTSQAVSGLTENTLYYARIRAENASGTSANSSSGNSPTLSNPPTVSTATSITTSNLTGNWIAPASQGSVATTYAIELSLLSNDFSSPVATAASISSNLSSYQFTGLSIGTSYYYRVKAVNSAGSSAWSSVSAGATTLPGYISLTALGTAATEDFNTLASTGSSSALPNGWYLSESGSNANSIYTAGIGSVTTGDTYSFGTSSDLAFGGLQTGSLIPTNGAKFKNNSGSTINNLFISYTGETWRVGTASRVDRLDFQYSTDATSLSSGTWIDVNILDYANPGQAIGSGSIQHSSSISNVITGLTIANGASFMIRWLDFNASGSDDGMGIDDFSIKPCGTTSAPTAADQSFCSSTSPTVSNLTATGTSIQWYAASSGGSALSTSTALTNSTVYASQTLTGCESATRASSTITLSADNTASAASSSPTLSINTALTAITQTTTGATGIGTATGLPAGVTAAWATNTITISGTPTASGTFSYSIPLTGGCGSVNATGTINVVGSCPTDLNNDVVTDVNDFLIFAPAFGTTNASASPTDLNSDGVTDVNDFLIFAPEFGTPCN
jgi:hypothetical protein